MLKTGATCPGFFNFFNHILLYFCNSTLWYEKVGPDIYSFQFLFPIYSAGINSTMFHLHQNRPAVG